MVEMPPAGWYVACAYEETMKLNRRQFLQASMWGLASAIIAPSRQLQAGLTRTLRIALLHLAPRPGELADNRRLLKRALITAAERQAAWILTPELSISGYTFADEIGTEWIMPQPDPWVKDICRLTARLSVTVFLSVPERDPLTQKLYNSVCVIAPDGTLIGCHRKINTLRVGSEAWSSPGEHVVPFPIAPFDRVGILICADAFSPGISQSLKAQGAQLLVSSAAWAPGLHGPNGEWEQRTVDTGLPLLVCNRTGPDRTLDFAGAQSVVVKDGRRLLSMSSERSTIFLIDWDLTTHNLATQQYRQIDL
jgi:5-aminopentanamidase